MFNFVRNYLEDSNLEILTANPELILVKADQFEKPVAVLLHGNKQKIKDVYKVLTDNAKEGYNIANIFYKDGEHNLRRLGASAFKRDEKSLKDYVHKINDLISVNNIEKYFIQGINSVPPKILYFQPKTERLKEGLRLYMMENVHLDYSHIPIYDRKKGFCINQTSKLYKVANEIQNSYQNSFLNFDQNINSRLKTFVFLEEGSFDSLDLLNKHSKIKENFEEERSKKVYGNLGLSSEDNKGINWKDVDEGNPIK